MRGSPKLILALIVALFGVCTYWGQRDTNEITGEVQHVAISEEQEVALGLQANPQMMAQHGGEVEPGHPVSQYVEAVGQRLVQGTAAGKSPYKFDFHVLKDPEAINAFALPGGQVSITVGLLRRLENEAQLAGVLGHEIGHVVGRHGAEHMAKQRLGQTLAGAGVIAAADPNDPRGTMRNAAIAQAVSQLVNMKFGREDELESDAFGIQYMSQVGYDPRGMTGVMKVLQQASASRGTPPEFFSTHPNPENRLARIEQLVQQAPAAAQGETGEARFRENVLKYMQQ